MVARGSFERRLRLRVRVHRRELDREISYSASPDGDPLRALRARQLGSVCERRAVAACFANILDAAAEAEAVPSARLRLDHRAVLSARPEIIHLIELLRSEVAINVRGVALARLLADDPTGLLVRPRVDQTLRQALADVIRAL
jgi:hypothetical protein